MYFFILGQNKNIMATLLLAVVPIVGGMVSAGYNGYQSANQACDNAKQAKAIFENLKRMKEDFHQLDQKMIQLDQDFLQQIMKYKDDNNRAILQLNKNISQQQKYKRIIALIGFVILLTVFFILLTKFFIKRINKKK